MDKLREDEKCEACSRTKGYKDDIWNSSNETINDKMKQIISNIEAKYPHTCNTNGRRDGE